MMLKYIAIGFCSDPERLVGIMEVVDMIVPAHSDKRIAIQGAVCAVNKWAAQYDHGSVLEYLHDTVDDAGNHVACARSILDPEYDYGKRIENALRNGSLIEFRAAIKIHNHNAFNGRINRMFRILYRMHKP